MRTDAPLEAGYQRGWLEAVGSGSRAENERDEAGEREHDATHAADPPFDGASVCSIGWAVAALKGSAVRLVRKSY